MNVLGLDTAADGCSVAICINGNIVTSYTEEKTKNKAEILMPLIAKSMNDVELEPKQLDLISVNVGPGSFTGLRVGVSAARGIALATGVRCAGVTITETIARAISERHFIEAPVLVTIDSRRKDMYLQLFGMKRMPVNEIFSASPDELSDKILNLTTSKFIYIAGNNATVAFDALSKKGWQPTILDGFNQPHARLVADLTYIKLKLGMEMLEAKPLYLRAADAIIPVAGGRLRP